MALPNVVLGNYQNLEISGSRLEQETEKNLKRFQMPEKAARQKAIQDLALEKVIAVSVIDIPQDLVADRAVAMAEEFALRLNQQGLSLDHYYKEKKENQETLLEKLKPIASEQLQKRFLLEAIAFKEHMQVTDAEFEKELDRLMRRYPVGRNELKEVFSGEEQKRLVQDMLAAKAMGFLETRCTVI